MAAWTPFFLGISTAAATLAGLLFIGIQFNIDMLVGNPGSRWYAVARSTFAIYTLLLLLPLVLVVPTIDSSSIATILVLAGIAGAFGAIRTWWPVWKGILHQRERLWQSFWLLITPLVIDTLLVLNGFALRGAADPNSVLAYVGYDLIALFAIALRNSWRILIEVAAERRIAAKPPNSPQS